MVNDTNGLINVYTFKEIENFCFLLFYNGRFTQEVLRKPRGSCSDSGLARMWPGSEPVVLECPGNCHLQGKYPHSLDCLLGPLAFILQF